MPCGQNRWKKSWNSKITLWKIRITEHEQYLTSCQLRSMLWLRELREGVYNKTCTQYMPTAQLHNFLHEEAARLWESSQPEHPRIFSHTMIQLPCLVWTATSPRAPQKCCFLSSLPWRRWVLSAYRQGSGDSANASCTLWYGRLGSAEVLHSPLPASPQFCFD